MRVHLYILTFLALVCCAMGAEEEKYTMRSLGPLVGKTFREAKPFLPPLVLLTKDFNARNTSQNIGKYESISVAEVWTYGVAGSSLTLTCSQKLQRHRAWQDALPAKGPDEFILTRLEWNTYRGSIKFPDFPKDIGVWPFGLNATCEPADVLRILGRPEINTLNENSSGKLTYTQWPYLGKPFEFTFRNKSLEGIAVVRKIQADELKEYSEYFR
jgi:hypothetical protein